MQQLAAAKVSRLAHDGSQPMAPPLSSGAPCVRASARVCVCVCEGERERGEDRERRGRGDAERKGSDMHFGLDLSRDAGARVSIRTDPLLISVCTDILLGSFKFQKEVRTSLEDNSDPDIWFMFPGLNRSEVPPALRAGVQSRSEVD